jgi:hypothetical protein
MPVTEKKDITVSFGREGRLNQDKEFSRNVYIKLNTLFREQQLNELKGCSLSVFICLALHMDADGTCWVSRKTIAKETGYSKGYIKKKGIPFLVKKGYIYTKRKLWTKELAYERLPVKRNKKGEDVNKKARDEILEKKLGNFTSSFYSLFPEDDVEESYPQGKIESPPESYPQGAKSQGDNSSPCDQKDEKVDETLSQQESSQGDNSSPCGDSQGDVFALCQNIPTKKNHSSLLTRIKEKEKELGEFEIKIKQLVDNLPKYISEELGVEFIKEFDKTFSQLPTLKQMEIAFGYYFDNTLVFEALEMTAKKGANIGYFFTLLDDFAKSRVEGKKQLFPHLRARKLNQK